MRWLLAVLALVGYARGAGAGEWQVDRQARDNQVRFESTVAGFSFAGVTDRIDGYVYWSGAELLAGESQLLFEVELNGLDTGIGKRDRDMRLILATDRWPKAVFKGQILRHEPVDSTVTAYRVTAQGRLSLHGVERELEVPGTVVVESDRSRVAAAFSIHLSDYGIEAPSLAAVVKVNQEIDVTVAFAMKHVQ